MNSVKAYLFYKKCIPVLQSTHNKLRIPVLNARFYKSSLTFVPYSHNPFVANRFHSATCICTRLQSNTMSRNMSTTAAATYEDIVKAQNDDNIVIIDVREQSEINETGKLPGSIHIPMGDVTNTLKNVSENVFKEKFGKKKPTVDSRIILSCRAGKRAAMVQEEMQKLGYKNVQYYSGGWLDWESKTKQ